MKKLCRMQRKRRSASLGFTLIEAILALTISTIIIGGVVSLQYMSARTINDIYGPTRSRSERTMALNQIRFRLCDGRIDSCKVFNDLNEEAESGESGRRIQFEDPNLAEGGAPVTSEFYFDPSTRTLQYKMDITDADYQVVAKGPIDVTFTKGSRFLDPPNYIVYKGTEALVTVYVQTSSELSYSKVDLRDGESVVYLRNI